MVITFGDHNDICTELINGNTSEIFMKEQTDGSAIAREHAKVGIGVGGHVELGESFFSLPRPVGYTNIEHLVHTEMLHHPVLPGEKIIILVVQKKRPWADSITVTVSAQHTVLCAIPGEVLKKDLTIRFHGLINLIDCMENRFIHGLDSAADPDLPPELSCLLYASELFQPADQIERFIFRYEL